MTSHFPINLRLQPILVTCSTTIYIRWLLLPAKVFGKMLSLCEVFRKAVSIRKRFTITCWCNKKSETFLQGVVTARCSSRRTFVASIDRKVCRCTWTQMDKHEVLSKPVTRLLITSVRILNCNGQASRKPHRLQSGTSHFMERLHWLVLHLLHCCRSSFSCNRLDVDDSDN